MYIAAFKHIKNKTCHQSANFENRRTPNLDNFHPLEVLDRVSETQLQVGGNYN